VARADPVLEELFLFVSDIPRSKAFYIGKLGFKPDHEGEDFVILRTGGTKILFHDAGGDSIRTGNVELEIRVDDVDRWYEALSKEGVTFRRAPFQVSHEGDPRSPRREARLTDPDGYGITLFSSLRSKG
jgi:catechol 2,3-dioxygenase-like lactoylglutathione lyase family enzyme